MSLQRKQIIGLLFVLALAIFLIFYFSNTNTVPENEFIKISNVKAGQTIVSPLLIKGTVTGGRWSGFEGQVGRVELVESGNILGVAPLMATSDFMKFPTSFEAILTFNNPNGKNFTLVFHNENPSGLAEYEEVMTLPVRIFINK